MIEFTDAEFNDVRLTKRLGSIVADLAEHPGKSLPEALGEWSKVKAAYRFLDNEKVTVEAISEAERKATIDKIQDHSTILAVQDTTSFNYTLHRDTEGLGPIGQAGLSGIFQHSCLAVSTEGVPLGMLERSMWVRPEETKNSKKTHKSRPLEDKESVRWINMTLEVAAAVPSSIRVVMVGDRESDIYDLFVLKDTHGCDFLVRAAWNRRLDKSSDHLWEAALKAPELGQTTIKIPRADERKEREATLTLRSTTVTFRPPSHRKKENLPPITVNALLIQENDPPAGVKPVEWMLLTTLPVATLEDALSVMTWYTYRWRIERYHYTLKSGCQVEKLELETADRLMRALAVYSLVALRLLSLTYQARQTPDAVCTVALNESEWHALYAMTHKTAQLPSNPPDLKTAVLWIAKLGGFLGRKGDGHPGVKVLWRGFRRLQDLTAMWEVLNSSKLMGNA